MRIATSLIGFLVLASLFLGVLSGGPRAEAVKNGQSIDIAEVPWLVGVRTKLDPSQMNCGGALIARSWVLTAAHCVEGEVDVDVVVGQNNPASANPPSESIFPVDVFNLPFNCLKIEKYHCLLDVALLRLRDPVPSSVGGVAITPIALPSPLSPRLPAVKTFGWSDGSEETFYDSPRYTFQGIIAGFLKPPYKSPYFLAASNPLGSDRVCPGDSGGPVVNVLTDVLEGIVSRSNCSSGGSIHSDVRAYTMPLLIVMAANPPTSSSDTYNRSISSSSWVDTGIDLASGDRVAISATGVISTNSNQALPNPPHLPEAATFDADGDAYDVLGCTHSGGFPTPGLPCWSLVSKVGPSGSPFVAGTCLPPSDRGAGRLYLALNDDNVGDNSGSWDVTITVIHSGAPSIPCEKVVRSALWTEWNDGGTYRPSVVANAQTVPWPPIDNVARYVWNVATAPTSQHVVEFRHRFHLPASAAAISGNLVANADNAFSASLNGAFVGSEGTLSPTVTGDEFVTIGPPFLISPVPGENVLSVLGGQMTGGGINPAGLTFKAVISYSVQ